MSYLVATVTWSRAGNIISSPDIMNYLQRLIVRKGSDAKANTVEIRITNPIERIPVTGGFDTLPSFVNDDGSLNLEEGDTFTIQARYTETKLDESELTDSDILTIADLQEWTVKLEEKRNIIILKCVDKTFAILNQLVAQAIPLSEALASPDIIQRVIQTVSFDKNGSGNFGVDAQLQTESTYSGQVNSASGKFIQTRRINDSVFPDSSISKVYKPAYEWIDDLSSLDFTNNFDGRDVSLPTDSEENPTQNRKMRYFLDKDNKFHWFYPNDTVDFSLSTGTQTTDGTIYAVNLTKSTFDVVNMVIYNGGLDWIGAGTLNYYFDESTTAKSLLMKYKAYTDIAVSLKQDELNAGNIVEDTAGTLVYQEKQYNRASGSFTPTWGGSVVTDDDEYNDSFRAEVDRRARNRARALTQRRGNPRWKGTLDLKGQNYQAGELISFTSFQNGINQQRLRIIDLTHQITPRSWSTSMSLEEDDPIIGTNVPNF